MKSLFKICSFIFLVAVAVVAAAQSGTICGNPATKSCTGQYDDFKPQDLIFNTGRAQLGTGTHHESDEFYAVILESIPAKKAVGASCNFISEAQRRAAQKLFPNNKVFASRKGCKDMIVGYTNTSDDFNFMAIYAGESETEAAKILAKAKKKYPSANIRKMRVVLDFADE